MSRNTTPSILATLTAYDSSGDEEIEEEEEEETLKEKGQEKPSLVGQGQVTVLFQAPLSESSSSLQNPPSLLQQYDDDEENFEYQRPPEQEEEQEEEELAPAEECEDKDDQRGSPNEFGLVDLSTDKPMETNETEEDNSSSQTKRKVRLPPEPEGACAPELQRKFAKMYEIKMRSKRSVNQQIQKRKDLRNPSIYEKLIILCNIDEYGTNFPDAAQTQWDPSSYYDQLEKSQREEMERRVKDKKAKEVKVDIVTGTAKKPPTEPPKPPSAYIRAFGSLAFKN